ncbi:hypothetical protein [uncultured Alsobacter sp.]|uniref:hypothetical protein n=1 Tax=uncultured Alsobacter sp. TaxID=1748258 RepID=UPI0025CBEA9C|nr:hypothetical protein [uncultured Alsobacter sp.]
MQRTGFIAAALCLAASASSAEDARVAPLVAKIYRNFDANGRGLQPLGKDAKAYFDDSLIRLFKADSKRAGGEVGTIDYNPLCSCQDFDIKNVSFVERSSDDKTIIVDVTFENSAAQDGVTLVLSKTKAGLRIFDIGDKQAPSIRKVLSQAAAN